MSRSSWPALSRRMIVQTALELMDRDGYAAFSMPKLGDELGIRTPSLYHHFKDRAEIMAEVAKRVALETEVPRRRPDAPWTEYFVDLAVNFRQAILRHHNAAPVLLQFLPRDVLTPLYEAAAALLAEVPDLAPSSHVLVIDGLEKLTIGTALIEAGLDPSTATVPHPFPRTDPAMHPRLAEAVRQNRLDSDQLFVGMVRAFLAGVPRTTNGDRRTGTPARD